jgi:hypothetical protein
VCKTLGTRVPVRETERGRASERETERDAHGHQLVHNGSFYFCNAENVNTPCKYMEARNVFRVVPNVSIRAQRGMGKMQTEQPSQTPITHLMFVPYIF